MGAQTTGGCLHWFSGRAGYASNREVGFRSDDETVMSGKQKSARDSQPLETEDWRQGPCPPGRGNSLAHLVYCYECFSGPGFLKQFFFRISMYLLQIKTVYLFALSLSAYLLFHCPVLLRHSGLRVCKAVMRAILVPDLRRKALVTIDQDISHYEASSFPTLLRVLFSF